MRPETILRVLPQPRCWEPTLSTTPWRTTGGSRGRTRNLSVLRLPFAK